MTERASDRRRPAPSIRPREVSQALLRASPMGGDQHVPFVGDDRQAVGMLRKRMKVVLSDNRVLAAEVGRLSALLDEHAADLNSYVERMRQRTEGLDPDVDEDITETRPRWVQMEDVPPEWVGQ